MATSIAGMLVKRPVDRAAVEEHKKRMLDEVSAYLLREQKHPRGGDGMAFCKR